MKSAGRASLAAALRPKAAPYATTSPPATIRAAPATRRGRSRSPTGRSYPAAVGRRMLDVAGALRAEQLDEAPGRAHLRMVVEEGALGPNAGWVEHLWDGKPTGWFLAQLGLAHNHLHVGEVRVARGLLEYRAR
jgi:hypothetical protein